jgi:spermidine dehydrogenase
MPDQPPRLVFWLPPPTSNRTSEDAVNDWKDRELGMDRGITRRDFLNGVALAVGAAILPSDLSAATVIPPGAEKSPDYYPPALTGLRGSHPGSFDAAHSLRDGTFWGRAGSPSSTGEKYDLVVVGGGISGLSAAHFFRRAAGPKARVLVLDNHDDFGGHAKRNEFHSSQRACWVLAEHFPSRVRPRTARWPRV